MVKIHKMELMLMTVTGFRYGHIVAIFIAQIGVIPFHAQQFMSIKHIWRRLSYDILIRYASHTVVIVGHLF